MTPVRLDHAQSVQIAHMLYRDAVAASDEVIRRMNRGEATTADLVKSNVELDRARRAWKDAKFEERYGRNNDD